VSNVIWQPSPAAWGVIKSCPTCQTPEGIVATAIFNDGGRDMYAANNIMVSALGLGIALMKLTGSLAVSGHGRSECEF
jgi:hypothetical protein